MPPNTAEIYADPELAADYLAEAWACARQAHRRTSILMVVIFAILGPFTTASYLIGYQQLQEARQQVVVAERRSVAVQRTLEEMGVRVNANGARR